MPLIRESISSRWMANLNGEGSPFVLRLRRGRSENPPHWHPTDENITMLQGTLLMRAAAFGGFTSPQFPGGIT